MLDAYGPVMSTQEVCESLMIGKNTVYQLVTEGKLKAYRTGRTWKINRDGLIDFIRKEAGLNENISRSVGRTNRDCTLTN